MDVPEPQQDHEDSPEVTERERFWVVALVAALVAAPLVALQLWQVTSADSVERMVGQLGGEVPAASAVLFNLNRLGLTPVIVLFVDVSVFAVMLALARRYWIGLLFVPALVYLGMSVAYYLTSVAPLLNSVMLVRQH